jgi:hypothetical protein
MDPYQTRLRKERGFFCFKRIDVHDVMPTQVPGHWYGDAKTSYLNNGGSRAPATARRTSTTVIIAAVSATATWPRWNLGSVRGISFSDARLSICVFFIENSRILNCYVLFKT